MSNQPSNDPRRRAAVIASLSGLWAISAAGAASVRRAMAAPNWDDVVSDTRWHQRETKIEAGVAVIPIIGVITKYADFYDRHIDCVSASWITSQIEKAEADLSVKRIVLHIDSPGGQVDGSTQLAARVKRASKPIDAVGSDCMCSAAYYVASQCRSITMNETGTVGSIGVVGTGVDDSEFWAELGIKFVTVDSGGVKGDGHDHKITEALKAEWQRSVNDTFESFISAVASGRNKPIADIRRLGDGRTYRAAESLSLGLIDRVLDADVAVDSIKKEVITMTQAEFNQTASANPAWAKAIAEPFIQEAVAPLKPKAATLEELEAGFPGNEKFVLEQLRSKASMSDAQEAHRKQLVGQVATLQSEVDQLKAQASELDPGSAGLTKAINTASPRKDAGGSSLLCDLIDAGSPGKK